MGYRRKFGEVWRANERRSYYEIQSQISRDTLEAVKNKRADIIDPSSAVKDLSGTFSNPYANLGVATKAAEIQMEQTDAALANTLDTLRATGSGAGGATALAQAALQSKKGVAASIEQQEAQNQKLKAQGDSQLQQMVASEQQRVQAAKAAGMEFMFSAEEARTNADLDYAANKEQLSDDRRYQAEGDVEAVLNTIRNPRNIRKALGGNENDSGYESWMDKRKQGIYK
jgi:hypothetical protein